MTEKYSTGPSDGGPSAVEVRLRYRPSTDTLMGEVDLGSDGPTSTETTDDIDTDTSVTWVHRSSGSVEPFLATFSIIGARRRFVDRPPRFLPESVWSVARTMFEATPTSPAGSSARFEARAEARLVVPVADLRRTDLGPVPGDSDVSATRALSGALRDLGGSMRLALDAYDTIEADRVTPARRFLEELDALASLIAAHRRPAPDGVARSLADLRGGLPLAEGERRRLRVALERTLDPGQWHAAAHELNQLAAAVRGEVRIDSTEGS